ncbi:Fpg/Nei family DNA glycosylase [Micropruina sonneratiae]|uniref:Fpg/Nei family DNA glycosylase n=1 Tax=Micropruina sonneratiae TaxID=2986940 RepID=UPI002226E6D3|nr:DNA-formamidopyrimidine glycosylase family protein [Micropruina sp. KQZ13P-5]MCW3159151.1 Fpg/Nei family DNA glycosylase [Micropruina sp. KQZ13P-5]
MPELPEVEALRSFLTEHLVGQTIARTELLAFSSLKTFQLPLSALHGAEVDQVRRYGKFLAVDAGGTWLVFHLARAGWLTWKDAMPAKPARPGRGPLSLRVVLADDSGFDLTEMGTQRKLAVYVVDDPGQVPGIGSLGPDPLADEFDSTALAGILTTAGRSQLKGVLRDQRVIAGIGNAYSDEILHAAKLSPFKPANALSADEHERLFRAIKDELGEAIARSVGRAAKELKGEKKIGLRVHGRTGEPCDVCGTPIAEVSFADSSLQYCPTCQTGGKPLADRRLSKLLK